MVQQKEWVEHPEFEFYEYKRTIVDNTHERGETMPTELLVFKCFTQALMGGQTEELLQRVRVPSNIKTREEVRAWLAGANLMSARYMVISASQWDIVRIKSKTVKSAEWGGKAYVKEDGNGVV